jgi:hypothetical protein
VSLIAALTGCGVDFTLSVGDGEPDQRPARGEAVEVFIDGVQTRRVRLDFAFDPDGEESVIIELRYAGQTIAQREHPIGPFDCGWGPRDINASYYAFSSGDLRFGSQTVKCRGSTEIGDGFAFPRCHPSAAALQCGEGAKCSARAILLAPLFSRMDCVPNGTKLRGDSCNYVSDADGAYDDCAAGLVCVEGTCHELCEAAGCDTCAYVPGLPPELQICAAP